MSEVKPTLVQSGFDTQNIPINSWLRNFPTGKWIDAQSRSWDWIVVNVVGLPVAYEYRIRFDRFVDGMTLIFPYVVKTSDYGIKKVFIDGVEYQVRSKQNYGNMFIVSGQKFDFKIATRYKLDKQTVPIFATEYKQATFRSIEFLDLTNIGRLIYTSPDFKKTVNVVSMGYIAIHNTRPIFTTLMSTTLDFTITRTTPNTFNNVNRFSVSVIADCKDTSWVRFKGIWGTCDMWIPLITDCRDTSWIRFIGVWKTCGMWIRLI
jgi:hypothetical protein